MRNDENLEKLMKNKGEEALCISYFDQIIGPIQFYCNIPISSQPNFPNLNKIIEYNDEPGSFIFAFEKFQSLNYIFYLDSELARGGEELVMISYIIKASYFRNEIVDVFKYMENKKALLEEFAEELKALKELPVLFHATKKSNNEGIIVDLGSTEFKNKFLELYEKYYKKISPRFEIEAHMTSKISTKKIFTFGDRNVGKSTFLQKIEKIQSYLQKNNDLPTRIYDFIIDNIEILSYDCIEKKFECKKCENFGGCIKGAQGFILIFKTDDIKSFKYIIENLETIIDKCQVSENQRIPVIIVGNKFNNIDEIKQEELYSYLDFERLSSCGIKIKYFPMNLMKENEKVMDALRWLTRHIV
jgi:GTPase SAR1 family protein